MVLVRTIRRLSTVERDGQAFGRMVVDLDGGQSVRVLVQGEQTAVEQVCRSFADTPQPEPPQARQRPPTERELLTRIVQAASYGDLNAREIIRTILQESALGNSDASRLFRMLACLVPSAQVLRELAR